MRKIKAPRLVTVAIMTTITIIFWVFFEVYEVLTTDPPVKVPPEILEPISATLDTEALSKIEQRVFFEEREIAELSVQITPAPLPIPVPESLVEEETETEATESAVATPAASIQGQ